MAAPPSSASPRTAPSAASYTPKHLADKILQSKSALEGERKQVTVLFADVKGSMDLGEKVDPEEWYRMMDRFFQILSDGVHRFEGTVDKFTGDGIMAIFGAPIAHEDHARRAGRASANSPYNTAQECEVGKFKALDAEGNGSIFLASKCIASDDPRLKAK